MIINFLIAFCNIFLAYLIIQNTLNLIFAVGSLVALKRQKKYIERKQILLSQKGEYDYPPISILVPAYNEQYTIVESIKSLLNIDYEHYEIVIINDGSLDDTLDVLINEFELEQTENEVDNILNCNTIYCIYNSNKFPSISVIDKKNGGKADALNCGINASNYDLFICMDSDTLLEKDALKKIAITFTDSTEEIIAVGGTVRIINGSAVENGDIVRPKISNNLLVLMRCISYIEIFNRRICWSAFNGLTVLAGGFSIFKKSRVVEVGGYSNNTLTEDKELILRLHKKLRQRNKRYRIVHNPEASAWTQVPDNIHELKKQRIRLQKGSIKSNLLYKGLAFNPKYGYLGCVSFPSELAEDVIDPILKPPGYILILFLLLAGKLSSGFLILFIFFEILFRILSTTIALIIEKHSNKYSNLKITRFLVLSVIKSYLYDYVVNIWKLKGIVEYVFKKRTWLASERKSFNNLE